MSIKWPLWTWHFLNSFSWVQSLSHVQLFAKCSTPGLPVHHQSSLKLMSIELVMPSSHLILCRPLLLLPLILPSIRVFSMSQLFAWGGQSTGVSAFSIIPSKEIPGLISFRMDWLDLLVVRGLSRVFSNTIVKSINSSVLSFLHSPTLTSIHDHWENHSLD